MLVDTTEISTSNTNSSIATNTTTKVNPVSFTGNWKQGSTVQVLKWSTVLCSSIVLADWTYSCWPVTFAEWQQSLKFRFSDLVWMV
jgi:hypothetical protein